MAEGTLDTAVLCNELISVRDWRSLGLNLGVKDYELDQIESSHPTEGNIRWRQETFSLWLRRTPNASWKNVIEALQKMRENTLAERIHWKYIGTTACPPISPGTSTGGTASPPGSGVTVTAAPTPKTSKQTSESVRSRLDSCASASSTVSDDVFISESASGSLRPSSSSQSEGSQKSPFGCGCGKCTFFSFIESGCPNPIPSASLFPYLEVKGLTPEQQQELRSSLQFESNRIMFKFQHLVTVARKSLMRRGVTVDELLSCLTVLKTFDPVTEEPLSPNCYTDLMKAETIPKVFIALSNYFSFFNYDIIDLIINELGTEEDKQELQKYEDDFRLYAKRRIYECPPQFGPVSEMGHAGIFVKVDSHYQSYTVQELWGFRKRLSEILGISSVLRLCQVEKGCFELMFQVSSFVQQRIFPLSSEQERALVAEGVIKLTSGNYEFVAKGEEDESEPEDTAKLKSPVCQLVPMRHDLDADSAIGVGIFTDDKNMSTDEEVPSMLHKMHRKSDSLDMYQPGPKRHIIESNGKPFDPTEEFGADEQGVSGTGSHVLDSSRKTPPEFGGYDCEFVNPPPEILQTECSICQQVLREPQQTECGHVFCKSCIGRVQAVKKRCPGCNAELSTFPDKNLQRSLNQLQVRCTYQNVGCDWTGELGELDKHLHAGCSIPCEFSYAGCMVRMTRTDTVTHMKEDQAHHIQLLAEKVKEQNGQIDEQNRQIHKLSMQLQSKDEEIENITQKMKELATKLQSKDVNDEIAKINQERSFTSEPLLLTVNKFEHRKRNNRDWYSESFYTHPQGYKMCVQVYANGSEKANGTHVSFFTRIMKGEYDNELPWPFQGEITVELLNQNADKDHHKHVYSYDKDCKHGCRVTIGEKNYGWGYSKFISHSELDQDSDSTVQLLKDDCLKFRLYCTVYNQ